MHSSEPLVFVDGASGYLGAHLVRRLAADHRRVRCLIRSSAAPERAELLRSFGAEVVIGDLPEQPDEVRGVLGGASAAVHLIGSVAPRRGESFESLHVEQTRRFVASCKLIGVRKVVMVTALGTSPTAASHYHRSKWRAERVLLESGLPHAVLRPSLIVGRQVGARDSKLIERYRGLIQRGSVVPLVAGGKQRLQPVFVGDVADAIVALLQQETPSGSTFELGGPDVVTLREVVEQLMSVMETRKRVVALPGFVAKSVAWACEAMQTVPLLSRDQVTLALEDNVCRDNALTVLARRRPTSINDALKTYLTPLTHA